MRATLAVFLIIAAACGTEEDQQATESPATTCTQVGSSWWSTGFPDQTGKFHVEFDATPSGGNIDAVVGVGAAPATAYSSLAAIVRFNSSGIIDARSGDQYVSQYSYPYQAGVLYHVRMDIDVKAHTYSAYFAIVGSTRDYYDYYPIATNLTFRTEQASVSHLAYASSKLDSPGSLQVCGLTAVQDATTADGCVVASAGDGFVDLPAHNATVLDSLVFYAMPSIANIDAVIGLSSGRATAFSNLATAVRFAPTGYMDVRDGDGYRSDDQFAYASKDVGVRAIADITTHTYSVELSSTQSELAHQYHFRTQQQSVANLDHATVIVDSSAGSIRVCEMYTSASQGVKYSREGSWFAAGLPNGQAVLSDGTSTSKVDAGGHVLAQVARGGRLATDASGNIFLANLSGTTATLEKLSPALVSQWTRTATVPTDARLVAVVVDSTGAPGVTVVSSGRVQAWTFTPAGTSSGAFDAPGDMLALSGSNVFVAWHDDQALHFDKRTLSGAVVWSNAYSGRAYVDQMVAAPDGSLVVGGALGTPMDFGGGTLPVYSHPESGSDNAYLLRLTASGAHVFSQRLEAYAVFGLATNGRWIVASSLYWTQLRYPQLAVLTMTGEGATDGPAFGTGFGEHGAGYEVSLAADGRIWWNMTTGWPNVPEYGYMLAL